MVTATRKMNEFKDGILARIDEKFKSLKTDIVEELKDQIKNELAEVLKEEFNKREELESTVSVLQEFAHYYQNQVNELRHENEELGTIWEKAFWKQTSFRWCMTFSFNDKRLLKNVSLFWHLIILNRNKLFFSSL